MLNEYNDYALTNPNGRSGGIPQYLPSRFDNEKLGAVGQYPARHVRQQSYVAQGYEWRRKDDREDEDGDAPERESVPEEQGEFQEESFSGGAEGLTGSESALAGAQAAAASVAATVSAVAVAAVYVYFLLVSMTPCSATTDALAFTLSVQNPDNVPLVAVLTSETGETITRDATNATYLLFDGLEKGTKYELAILNAETGETLARQSYVTAEEDPYSVSVENAQISPDGIFSFDLNAEGLRRSDFYTVTVMGADGKPLFSVDGTDAEASFSVPIGTLPEGVVPFVTVSVNGQTYMPRVWEEPDAGGGAEPQPDAETPPPPDDAAPTIPDAPEETPTLPDAPENPEEPTQAPETPEAPPETETPETPPETPEAPPEKPEEAPQTPAETPQETAQAPEPPAQAPQEPTPPPEAPQETAQPPQEPPPPEAPQEPEPEPETPQEQEPEPEAPDEEEPQAKWTWNEEHTAVTAEIPDPDNPGAFVTAEALVTESVREPTCTEDGERLYSASVEGPDGKIYTDTRSEPIPAKGHSYERVSLRTEPGSSSADYICSECGAVYRMSAAATQEPPAEGSEP